MTDKENDSIDEQINAGMEEGFRRVTEKRNYATIFITLGSGNEFGISNHSMFIRSIKSGAILDLGPPTKENLERLISHMRCLECHLEE